MDGHELSGRKAPLQPATGPGQEVRTDTYIRPQTGSVEDVPTKLQVNTPSQRMLKIAC